MKTHPFAGCLASVVAAAIGVAAVAATASAADYPIKPVRFIVPAAPGGTTDGLAGIGSTPEDFRKFLLADLNKWADVVKRSGAKLE